MHTANAVPHVAVPHVAVRVVVLTKLSNAYSRAVAIYCSCAFFGACAYISTGSKFAPIREMRLISNDIPGIGSALQFEICSFHSIGS